MCRFITKQISSSHSKVTCSRHNIAKKLLIENSTNLNVHFIFSFTSNFNAVFVLQNFHLNDLFKIQLKQLLIVFWKKGSKFKILDLVQLYHAVLRVTLYFLQETNGRIKKLF